MRVNYCFEAQKRVGSEVATLLTGELSVYEPERGLVTYEMASLCHGFSTDSLTRPVSLREREIELEAHSPEGAEHPYRVSVHAAEGDMTNTVEVWVAPAGEPEMMLRFHISWEAERSVRFETHGSWLLLVSVYPDADIRE